MLQVQGSPASHCSIGTSGPYQEASILPGRSERPHLQRSDPIAIQTIHHMISFPSKLQAHPVDPIHIICLLYFPSHSRGDTQPNAHSLLNDIVPFHRNGGDNTAEI